MWLTGVLPSLVLLSFAIGLYFHQQRPRLSVTVVTMVKNEGPIMHRFLKSAKRLTPHIVICDTGSTDHTRNYWAQYPTVHVQWHDDFAKARNECLEKASYFVKTMYVALLDADHEVMIRDISMIPQSMLNFIATGNHPGANALPYLVHYSGLTLCRYKGVTHEFLDCGNITTSKYHGFWLNHHQDGSHRTEKFEKDRQRLEAAYPDEPDPLLRIRYAFYLARTYDDLGQYNTSLDWYEKRSKWGGWEEEVWFSKYRSAVCLLYLNKRDRAKKRFIHVYKENPHRREPLYWLAFMAREAKEWPQCLLYARAGMLVAEPYDNALFVDFSIYTWALEEELAWCLVQTGHQGEAQGHWKRMINNPHTPANIRKTLQDNLLKT